MGKHRWFAIVVSLTLVLPAMAACATPSGTPGGSGETPGATSPTTGTPTTGAAQSSGTKDPGEENPGDMLDPTQPGTPKTLRGTVSEGVEANCMLLAADDGKSYLLLGGDRNLIKSGARLEVAVLIQPDLMTTCQEGIPATVVTVRKI